MQFWYEFDFYLKHISKKYFLNFSVWTPSEASPRWGDRAAVSEHWSEPDIETDSNENNKLNINSNYKIERLVSVNLKVKFWLADVVHDIMKPKALRLHPVPDDTGWGVCSLRFELSGLSWLSAHEPLW